MILSSDQARSFYNWFGARQDLQRLYEDPAIDVLLAHAGFDDATAIVELGCGTGRLAERLFRTCLPRAATYFGVDISETMVALASERLRPWADRAKVRLTDGSLRLPVANGSYDRFLSTYVLDLLSLDDIGVALREARRVLIPGGRLCLASLTFGRSTWSRAVCRLWQEVHARRPMWVGGCRPLELSSFVRGDWRVLHSEVVCTMGVCTEIVVAT